MSINGEEGPGGGGGSSGQRLKRRASISGKEEGPGGGGLEGNHPVSGVSRPSVGSNRKGGGASISGKEEGPEGGGGSSDQ